MKKFVLFVASAVMAIVTTCESVKAGTIYVDRRLDVSRVAVHPSNDFIFEGSPPFSSGLNLAIANGDTLDIKIDFLAGQSLTVKNLNFAEAYAISSTSAYVDSTGTFTFLDASGSPILTSKVKTDGEGAYHFGQIYGSTDFIGLPYSLTFSGVEYVGKLNYYFSTPITTRNYTEPGFSIQGSSVTFNSAVPEPSTFALLGLGSLVLAVGAYRRRAAV